MARHGAYSTLFMLALALSPLNLGAAAALQERAELEKRQTLSTTTTTTTTTAETVTLLPTTTSLTTTIETLTLLPTTSETSESSTTTTVSTATDGPVLTSTESSTTSESTTTTSSETSTSSESTITSTSTSSDLTTSTTVTSTTSGTVDPRYTGNPFTLSSSEGPLGENAPVSGTTRRDIILRVSTTFSLDGFGYLVSAGGFVAYSTAGGSEQVFTNTRTAGGLARRQTPLVPLTCAVLNTGVLTCNGANGNVFYTDGVNLYLGADVPAGFTPIVIVAALVGAGSSTTTTISGTVTVVPTAVTPSGYWGNWVAITGSGVPVPLTTTIVLPGAQGPVTQTITVTSLHCGCTETPVPTKIVMTTYVTDCPQEWGYTAPVTVTVPVKPTSTPWGGADVYYECDEEEDTPYGKPGSGSNTVSGNNGGYGSGSGSGSGSVPTPGSKSGSGSGSGSGYNNGNEWKNVGGGSTNAGTGSGSNVKPTASGYGSGNGTSPNYGTWSNVSTPKYQGSAATTGISTALLALSGALIAVFA